MKPWGNNYSPSQMLDFCKVDGLRYHDAKQHYVAKILAQVAVAKSPNELMDALGETVGEIGNATSIGMSLEHLHRVATTGSDLDYGRDGLDALTYHLNADSCRKGIAALQAVLRRFDEDRNKPEEEPRDVSGQPQKASV